MRHRPDRRRGAPVGRRRAGMLTLLAALALGGCVDITAEDATEVDRERLTAVLADPWLAPVSGLMGRLAAGTNRGYRPGTVWSGREIDGPRDEVARMELAAAAEAGWWVTYGRCPLTGEPPEPEPDKPDEPRPPTPEADAVVVHLARDLGDGSFAQAVLQLSDPPPDPAAVGPRTRVRIATYVANHLQPAGPPPQEVDVSRLACLAPPGTDPVDAGPVGEADLVNVAGRQPSSGR